MAGAELDGIPLEPGHRSNLQVAISESFLSGFRVVARGAALLALVAAAFGAGIGDAPGRNTKTRAPRRGG
jgi:hypothetical protein